MILTSALSRLTESMGRFENRYAGLGSRLGAAEYPEPNSTPRQHSVTESAESVGIVSYNILSFELADEEFYINLNNTPKIIDSKARMDAINTKVEWKYESAADYFCQETGSNGDQNIGEGLTEDEAIVSLCLKHGVKLWNEE